jgi:Reverse transcriptase (RNA-dependent DNA polymerase)
MKTAAGLRWRDVYREVELYKAAVRVYTKPLFHWRKALSVSADGKTLYELAGRGLRGLDAIHGALQREAFEFRPSIGLAYNFNGKRRTLYIPPWEERIVDLLLYRVLNQRLHRWFSPNSFAYRDHTYGLDSCQSRIARLLRSSPRPLYLVKRDISDYFASVHHEVLLRQLGQHVERDDYLFHLLRQRVQFAYHDETGLHEATRGIPFGCASACLFANIYLTELDRRIERLPQVHYFRYADDLLLLSSKRDSIVLARECLSAMLGELKLSTKASHEADLLLSAEEVGDRDFRTVSAFRHLGLLFRAGGEVSLSRDKRRKIQNLFRFAFRRKRRTWKRIGDPQERARTLAAIASETVEKGVRNVAIVDYYLKHVTEVPQLRLLDRWLAEEVLSLVFGGHKKGNFAKLSFEALREFGLPSLVHRRRLIIHGHTESPFFIWQKKKADRAFRGTVASLVRTVDSNQPSLRAQKQQLTTPVGEGGCL